MEKRDTNGNRLFFTNRYTLLENALNYRDENGQWRLSQDLIESFPEGAVARRGPHKAIFSPDLNADAVFDIQASTGQRLRGGVRSIHLTDTATGRSIFLGNVRPAVPGELLPPNRIVYTTPTYGRIWDNSGLDQYWYYYPSMMVNSQGDIVIGFSGSKSSEFIGAFYWGRRSDASVVTRPILVQAGRDYFHFTASSRWGDYSATALDPSTGAFCTFQQYSEFQDDQPLTLWGGAINTIKVN